MLTFVTYKLITSNLANAMVVNPKMTGRKGGGGGWGEVNLKNPRLRFSEKCIFHREGENLFFCDF